jgi:hypothetical protein
MLSLSGAESTTPNRTAARIDEEIAGDDHDVEPSAPRVKHANRRNADAARHPKNGGNLPI